MELRTGFEPGSDAVRTRFELMGSLCWMELRTQFEPSSEPVRTGFGPGSNSQDPYAEWSSEPGSNQARTHGMLMVAGPPTRFEPSPKPGRARVPEQTFPALMRPGGNFYDFLYKKFHPGLTMFYSRQLYLFCKTIKKYQRKCCRRVTKNTYFRHTIFDTRRQHFL